MSQNYIATQKIKGKKINFQNLQTRNDKSQIDFRRINSINNLQTNYNYIKEYLKSRQNKDTKQAKEFSLGTIKIAQNITKGAVNLKKKILTIKTNAEPIEQMKKEAIQKKIEPPNYRPSFTYTFSQTNKPSNDRYKKDSANNNIKKENNKDLIDLINMCSSSSDNDKKKEIAIQITIHILYRIIIKMVIIIQITIIMLTRIISTKKMEKIIIMVTIIIKIAIMIKIQVH